MNKTVLLQLIIAQLTHDPLWLGNEERVELLLHASTRLRPPSPDVVAFWDHHCQPDDGYTPVTVTVLVENGSEPALRLLEKKFADPAHEEGEKIAWMHSRFLTHRNDLLVLESCERLLKQGLTESLQTALVESLFDYKPDEWFRPSTASSPPDRRQATPAARAQLRKIGEYAFAHVRLTDDEKRVVKDTLDEVGEAPKSPENHGR